MAKKPAQTASSSGYWENLRKKRRLEQEQKGELTQEGLKNLLLGRIAGAAGLAGDIGELTTPPLVTPPASLKAKGMKPFPAGMTPGEMPPKDGKGLTYRYTSPYFAEKFGISPAELIAGDVVGPGAPVSAATGLAKGAAATVKGLNVADLAAASSALVTGIFAGKRARNLPKLSYDRALEGEKAGVSKYQIYKETGFWKGPDGAWRFEISDMDISVDSSKIELAPGASGKDAYGFGKMDEVVSHPELFKAYPELKDIVIKFDPKGMSGSRSYAGYYTRRESIPNPKYTPEGNEPLRVEREVIMLRAPTKESEIARLTNTLEVDQTNLDYAIRSIRDYEEMLRVEGALTTEQMSALANYKRQIQNLPDTIKVNTKELKRLQDGGHPEMDFTFKSVLTHELQHAIQRIEGFPTGGNPEGAWKSARDELGRYPEKFGLTRSETTVAKQRNDRAFANVRMLYDLDYLHQLEKFKLSDNPTQNARFIRNSGFMSTDELAREIGSPPNRRNKQKYGQWLRDAADVIQRKIINQYSEPTSGELTKNTRRFKRILGDMFYHEANRGLDVEKYGLPQQIGDERLKKFSVTDDAGNFQYGQPWATIPRNIIQNAIKREQTILRQTQKGTAIDDKLTKELDRLYRLKDHDGYHRKIYNLLAGEAEARAVQERYRLSQVLDSGDLDKIPTEEGGRYAHGAYDVNPADLFYVYDRNPAAGVAASAAVNVPKSDMGFTSPALRVILGSQKEQMPKEMWLKYLRGNGVKDPELEFSGLGSWLKEQKGQVSKQQLEEYMTTQNQLKIEEVVYGGKDADEDYMVMKYVEQRMNEYEFVPIGQDPAFADDIAEDLEDYIANWKNGYYTKVSHPLLYKNKNVAFETEDEAREFFKAEIENQYVVVDPNGEYVRDSGGTIDIHPTVTSARQEMDYRIESDARRMSKEELMQYTGVEETSQDFYGPVKYGEGSLTTPGGENYRELVLYWDKPGGNMLPPGYTSSRMPDPQRLAANKPVWAVYDEKGTIVNTSSVSQEKAIEEVVDALGQPGTESLWFGSHQFTDKPNPLLHIRFNERVDADGKKILFIEEIQSDIAKRGQKEGFKPGDIKMQTSSPKLVKLQEEYDHVNGQYQVAVYGTGPTRELEKRIKELDTLIEAEKLRLIPLPPGTKVTKEKKPGGPEMWKVETGEKFKDRSMSDESVDTFWGMDKEEAIANAKYFIRRAAESGIDRAPFIMDTKDYMELGLKRMILWASDNGFDKVAWTTGEQQMKRYNKMVEGIQELTVARKTGKREIDKESNTFRVLGTGVGGNNLDSGDITRKQLDDYVGERVAEKVVKDMDAVEEPSIDISLKGETYESIEVPVEDLKLPQDPKHFLMVAYDKTLKNVAQSLGKKYDARVGQTAIETEKPSTNRLRYEIRAANGEAIDAFPTQEMAETTVQDHIAGGWDDPQAPMPWSVVDLGGGGPETEPIWTLNLSEKLKSAAKQGLPYMAAVPPGALLYQKQQERDRTPVNRAAARPLAMQANVQ